MKHHNSQKGFGLIEVMVGAGIITVAILALFASYNIYLSYAFTNQNNVRAASLLEEGVEAVKLLRDSSWTSKIATLSSGTTYYLYWDNTNSIWTATTTVQPYIDSIFNRTFTVASVNRDGNNDIAASGTADSGTKLITVNVTYKSGHSTTTSTVSTYITNLQSN